MFEKLPNSTACFVCGNSNPSGLGVRDSNGVLYARAKGRYLPVSDEQTREVVGYLQFDEDCVGPERICRIME